jgi:hypothetical protein
MKTKEPITEPLIVISEDVNGNIAAVDVTLPLFKREDKGGYWVQCPVTKTVGFSKEGFEQAELDHEADLDVFLSVHIQRKTLKWSFY